MRALTLLLALALTLGGCAGIEAMKEAERSDAEANIVPANYRSEIVALMRTYLNDPTNVRGAFVTEPVIKPVGGGLNRYSSCLRYNAKKTGGQYAGSRDNVVIFSRGKLERLIDREQRTPESIREQCKDAAYLPFPELERMTR